MWLLLTLACSTPAPTEAPEVTPAVEPAAPAVPAAGVAAADAYAEAVGALIEHATDTSIPLAQIGAEALDLATSSVEILHAFSAKEPSCKEYLDATIAMLAKLDELDAEALEQGYHRDGALPEASGICYHAKDLLVHPASVVALARGADSAETREEMEHELKEVQAHVRAVRQQIE